MQVPSRQLCDWQNPNIVIEELMTIYGENGLIWLDGDGSKLGRWIKIAVDPIEEVCCRGLPQDINSSNPFETLRNLKPGHWTGWLSYEAGAWIEPNGNWKPNKMATLWMASHDPILKFDLEKNQLWVEGCNAKRIEEFTKLLKKIATKNQSHKKHKQLSSKSKEALISIHSWQWLSTKDNYSDDVIRIKEWIQNGDIFQANLTTACTTKAPRKGSIVDIFQRLRSHSPSPFGGMIIGGDLAQGEAVISSSPERFLKVLPSGEIETRPIKGTRPRYQNSPNKDAEMAAELICSSKDRAENIMIVDVLRNDFGRVCTPGSIYVAQLVGLESYAQVHHLTSVIKGSLQPNKTWIDLLEACWPGGSITGAPKLRACKRLYELEKIARGPYCGSFINLDWDGKFDSNILIRSLIIQDKIIRAHAGCGIVADSDPNYETEELQWKLIPLLQALE
tara:strand:- start:6834 stop:8177 length:1344 start_codon:yes stop_codon:yes gene_type:complete